MLNVVQFTPQDKYVLTTLSVCGNAAGDVISPLIMYRSMNLHDRWQPLDGASYAATPSGWINRISLISGSKNIFG